MTLDRSARVLVAGHRGLVGSAVWRRLRAAGFVDVVGRSSQDVDLRDRQATRELFRDQRPRVVVLAAARVGGIAANDRAPVEFLSDNLRIQTNVLDAAHEYDVERLLFLGSSCIYPRDAPQPIPEEALLTGPLEPTNRAYAVAKVAGIEHVQALRREFGRHYVSAMPTNLYGPGDNFDLETSHVLPALVRRFHEARVAGSPSVTLWGSGEPRREFLHVDDLARACLVLLDRYDDDAPVNVGAGRDIAIRDLAALVARVVGYDGEVRWDRSHPDGTPRKLLDVRRITELGWRPTIGLEEGVAATYAWYVQHAGGGPVPRQRDAAQAADARRVLPPPGSATVVRCARVPITACPPRTAAEHVVDLARTPLPHGVDVHLCNAYTLALADKDRALRALLERAAVNFPDGQSVVWASRIRHPDSDLPRQRVYGPDLFLDVLDRGRQAGLRHYLLGSTPGVVETLAETLQARFPGLDVVGVESPPFRDPTQEEREQRAERIRASRAQVVWVALGTPKQDFETTRLAAEVPAVCVAVGAAFDFVAGAKPQAPRWVRDHGMEWAFRLGSEPRRLWRRYLFGNARFLVAALRPGPDEH